MALNNLKCNHLVPLHFKGLMWIVDSQQLSKLSVSQLSLTISVVDFIKMTTDLGMLLDAQLSLSSQVAVVCVVSTRKVN